MEAEDTVTAFMIFYAAKGKLFQRKSVSSVLLKAMCRNRKGMLSQCKSIPSGTLKLIITLSYDNLPCAAI